MSGNKSYWYNYVKGEYEYRDAPTTDEEALTLLPQIMGVSGAYECRRLLGQSITEAMRDVLLVTIGETPEVSFTPTPADPTPEGDAR